MGKEKLLKETKNSASANKTYTLTKVALIVVAVILVATLSLVFVQSSGIVLRSNTVIESENYKVSGTMMQYMVNAQYQSFYSSYGSYASIFGLDTTKSLKLQKFDTTNSYLGYFLNISEEYADFDGSWFDYFWQTSEDQMKSTLVLCEAAKEAGVTLGDEEKATIEDAIDNLYADMEAINKENREYYEKTYGQKNYVTFDGIKSYLTACYGQGVKLSDIREVLKLYSLAEKFYNQASDDTLKALKANSGEITAYYEANASKYNKADYLSYVFSASYTKPSDSTKVDETWNKYLDDVNKAMDNAKALSECTTVEAFKTFMIKHWFEKNWQTQYDKTITELKKKAVKDGGITDADIPAESVREEKKAAALAQIIDALLNDKEKSDLAPLGKTAFDGAVDAVKENLFTTLSGSSYYAGLEKLKAQYDDATDAGKWTFATDRKEGDIKYFANHDVEFIGTETTAAPETTEAAPETTEATPEATETAPEATGTAPEATEAAPEATGTAPEATEAAPEATDVAPAAETTPASTPAETEPKADPNWKTELDKDKTDDATFTVEVRFVLKPSYRIDETVRDFGHILISGDSFMEADKNLSEEDADAKAKEKAEKILADFKAGTIDKDAFEALATENTEDNGIFYSEIAPGKMATEINDWLFMAERKAGDLDIVKTDYGYHIMYLTEIYNDPAYFVEARNDLYAEKLEAMNTEWETKHTVKVTSDYAKANMDLVNE